MGSPFSDIPDSEHVAANDLAFAVRDRFPVSPGHTLVVTRRVVATWFEATPAEKSAVWALIETVKHLSPAGQAKVAPYVPLVTAILQEVN